MKIACYVRNGSVFDQIRAALARAGMEPAHFDSETTLMRAMNRKSFDFVLIDMPALPRGEGNVFAWLSMRSGDPVPTMIISSSTDPAFVARALNSGADDFLHRPFEAIELIARIHAVLRRCVPQQHSRTIEYAGFALDRETSKFRYLGSEIALTPREFSMAWLFFSSPGKYISRERISTVIWGADSDVTGRTIEQHVYKLRKKLMVEGRQGLVIRTAYGQGYRLDTMDDMLQEEVSTVPTLENVHNQSARHALDRV